MEVRPAQADDAEAAAVLVRRSIVEVCWADHLADEKILDEWLANKTAENFRKWVSGSCILVATEQNVLIGVAGITGSGEVTLNYVSPDARFRGVSKVLLRRLEEHAKLRGCNRIRLESTKTSHRFYLACGFEDGGQPSQSPGGLKAYPMAKQLT